MNRITSLGSVAAALILAASPLVSNAQTIVHKQTTTTHTEHNNGQAPVKVTVRHTTRHRTRPVHHSTTVTKHKTQTSTTTTTEHNPQ